ncbi:hypothetical protein WJ63_29900 [Burkholderia pyrrocinia]|nr:hypothetical protein WJ63_29900 [Burkholderia pyrrocinia]
MAPTRPGGLDDFTALVLPEPCRRGLFRSDQAAARRAIISGCGGPCAAMPWRAVRGGDRDA